MLRERLSRDHFLVNEILEKKLTGQEACMKLLSFGNLDKDGILEKSQSSSSRKILSTFQAFHNSWFPRFDFNNTTQDHPNANIHDKNEMAYHFTYALFGQNAKVSSVYTSKSSFVGVRQSKQKNIFTNDKDIGGKRFKFDDEGRKWLIGGLSENKHQFGGEYIYRPSLIEYGDLIGIKKMKPRVNYFQRIQNGKRTNWIDLNTPKFKGAMGTVPYLILNGGQNKKTADGGVALHRRWSTSVFKDFLCRTHPLLRKEDTHNTSNKKSSIAFRRDDSCMHCHHPIDSLARVARNVELFNAGEAHPNHFTFRAVDFHKVKLTTSNEFTDRDKKFHLRLPKGLLTFRNLEGRLINKTLYSPDDLGDYLSKIDDPYICTAKRYFDFFTGIDVQLYDFTSFAPKKDHTDFLKYRNFVVKLGKSLRRHQSLKRMVKDIISSDHYSEVIINDN
jgi:hypothetical protein